MKMTKIFGWILLVAGIILIVWTLLSTYNIFTAKRPAPEIFKVAKIGKQLEQLKEIIPTDALPKLLNLIAWSILAGILIFGGSQISILGIKLIKNKNNA